MQNPQVIWTVAGVVVLEAVIIGGGILWMVRRLAAIREQLESSIGLHERVLIPPGNADFSGGSRRFGPYKGSGVMALTDRRLLFRRVIGAPIEIGLEEIESVSRTKWYRGLWRAGRRFVVLHLKDGQQAGFLLKDPEPMVDALERAIRNR